MKNKNIKILLFVLLFVINISFVSGWNNSNKWNSDNIKSYLKFTPFYDSIYINSENNIGLFWFNKLDSNFYYIDKNGSHSFNSGSSGGNTDTLNTNEINFNVDKSTITQSNINYYYPATIDNFDSLNTTDWILTSPAVIQDGNLILSGNGGGIVSNISSGDAAGGAWKWEFSHLKLSDGHNYVRFGFTSDNSVNNTERIVQIDGYKNLYIYQSGISVWSHTYTEADDIYSIMIKKMANDSCKVYVNDTLRKIIYYNFATYKYPSIYATQLNYASSNDSILVDVYTHGSLYSNANISYDYNNNVFIFFLDGDTMATIGKGKINSDTLNARKIYSDTMWMNGKYFYNDGTYFQMGYIGASIANISTSYLYTAKNTWGNPFVLQCGYNYNDSLIFIFTGAGEDSVAVVDSFNNIYFKKPVNMDTLYISGGMIINDGYFTAGNNGFRGTYIYGTSGVLAGQWVKSPLFQNQQFKPFQIKCDNSADDSIIYILLGMNDDTVMTVDSFNIVRIRNEVVKEKPGFFVYQDSNTVETAISTQGTWYAIDNWTIMDTSHIDILGDTAFIVRVGGDYCIHCSMSALATASGDTYDMGLFVNDTLYSNALISERYFSSSNIGSWSFIGKANLQAGDTIALKVRDISGTKNLLFKYGQFLIEAQ